MKRIFHFGLALTVIYVFNSCDIPIGKYEPKNDDEKSIINLLNTHVDARNNGDTKTLASLFQDDGVIFYSGNKWTKNQIADSNPEEWSRFQISLFNLGIKIHDKEATVNTILKSKMGFDKWKLPIVFTLNKKGDKWLISEVTGYGSSKAK